MGYLVTQFARLGKIYLKNKVSDTVRHAFQRSLDIDANYPPGKQALGGSRRPG
jgi:hypothetical protein